MLVGTWDELRDVRTPATLEEGPEASGVFARFADDGERLELLDEDGDVARDADAGHRARGGHARSRSRRSSGW